MAKKLRHRLEQIDVVVVANHDEAELLQMGEERVDAIDNMIAPEHDARRAGLLERAVERQTLEPVCMGYPRKDDMRDAGVD